MDHAADLVPRLRTLDLAEIEAASGRPALDVLGDSLARAVWAEAAMIDGRVEAIGGLGTASLTFGPGVPWLLGSDRLTERPRWFLAESQRRIDDMLASYDALVKWVDVRNAPAIRYLRWLGFAFDRPAPFGVQGLPFHRFQMRRVNAEERR